VLRRLRIENLVLIREAELELAPGLNAITGETGAGKTILAQAVGLLLGTKGDDSFVGPAGREAYVEAELDLPAELDELAELLPEDEDALVVARRVFGDGRTRAYAWGRAAAREDVAAAVERVVAMSGQFEQRRLARPSYQLEVLDRFCGEEQLRRRAEAQSAWRELLAARRRREELTADTANAEARRRSCARRASACGTSPSSRMELRRRPMPWRRRTATARRVSPRSLSGRSRRSSGSRPSSSGWETSFGRSSCVCARRRRS
jgi:DNA repair protein RecN (Recombination protein N)